jgi:hypothetical protein
LSGLGGIRPSFPASRGFRAAADRSPNTERSADAAKSALAPCPRQFARSEQTKIADFHTDSSHADESEPP